jgi:3-oxoacyl-[acyl-carrier protein] reductase
MDLRLNEKVAIVTGASRGIGRAVAGQLAAEGMRLVLVARTDATLKEVADTCRGESLVLPVDLRDPDVPNKVVETTLARFGQIDLLVNNAGATKRGDFVELPDVDWNDGFALKFFGAMRMCRAAWPHLKKQNGSIINISGIGGRTGSSEFSIGGAVNAALLNLTKSLADLGVIDGVRVNAINPSSILTDRLQIRISKLAQEQNISFYDASQKMSQKLGVSRFGQPEEIAALVAFLASHHADYCQGSIIDVDGGKTRTL